MRLALPAMLIGLWEVGARSGFLPAALIASPSAVMERAVAMTADGSLLAHSLVSLQRLAIGFGSGTILAVVLGLLVGSLPAANRLLSPTVAFLAPVPVTAWIPLIIVLTGIGEASKSTILAVGAFFPVFFATVVGLRSASNELVEVARIYCKPRTTLIRTILFPSAVPYVFQGMRSALGLGWVLLVVAEVIASDSGLGWLMWDARTFGRPDEMIVGMAAAGLLGALSAWILSALEKKVLYWREDFGQSNGR